MLERSKGITNFQLKYIAMFAMVLDHIHYMFEYTGKVPVWFSVVGRLAAPIFLFCLIEGFEKTRNQKKYFMNIYLISIVMGAIRFGFYNVLNFAVRGDGFWPQNAMLSSFVPLLIVLFGLQSFSQKKYVKGTLLTVVPIIMPFLLMPLYSIPNVWFLFTLNMVNFTVLPVHSFLVDGGTATLMMGIVLYLFRKNRIRQLCAFGISAIMWDVFLPLAMGYSISDLISHAYEWVEVFAIVPLLCYNGKRGTGNKWLFYIFYPLHIYVLYGISLLIYR